MKMKWTFFIASLATTGFAQAAEVNPDQLSSLVLDPQEVLEALAVNPDSIQHSIGGRKEGRLDRDERRQTPVPKACTDAAIRDDQKTAIEGAVLNAKREKIQLKADLKVAMMDYSRAAMDQISDKGTADAAAAKIAETVQKLASVHIGLATQILYDLVTPEQRKNTFLCLVELHKRDHQKKCKKQRHGRDDMDDRDNNDRDEDND